MYFLPYFKLNEDDSDDKNKLFVNYPKSDPVLAKINRFIYPIYYGEDAFLGTSSLFEVVH